MENYQLNANGEKWYQTITFKMVLLVSGTLTTLYIFIFILLALKEYSYLAGNIGLFVLLAVMMIVSARQKLFRQKSE